MGFIRKGQESAGNTAVLQDIEKRETFRDRKTVVFLTVDDELGSIELQNVFGSRWVPAAIVVTVCPESAIELEDFSTESDHMD